MTKEEKKLLKKQLLEILTEYTAPVFDLVVEDDKVVAKYNDDETKKELKKLKKLFTF